MGSIPLEYYEGEVRACTGYSWVLSMENRTGEAKLWADKAQSCFNRIKDGLATDEKDFLAANVIMAKANIAILEPNMEQVGYYFKQADGLKLYQPIVVGELNSGEVSILKTAYGCQGRLKKFDEFYTLLAPELPRLS